MEVLLKLNIICVNKTKKENLHGGKVALKKHQRILFLIFLRIFQFKKKWETVFLDRSTYVRMWLIRSFMQ